MVVVVAYNDSWGLPGQSFTSEKEEDYFLCSFFLMEEESGRERERERERQ